MPRISAALILLTCLRVQAQPHRAGDLALEPYTFRTYDGATYPSELGHLWVSENRDISTGRLLQLAFVRIKTTSEKPRPPIVFLPGGPGIPATGIGRVPVYFALFKKLLTLSDVILLDQRGIGMSSPNTECPKEPSPPRDVFLSEATFRAALIARARTCAASWRAQALDLTAFTTAASADDLEDLRHALGAPKLSLIGHSYGTTLALEAVRRHGEHLDRVVLAGVDGPDHQLHLPLVSDFALRKLSAMAAASPQLDGVFPDTYGEFRRVQEKLAHEPLIVHVRDEQRKQEVELKIGALFLQFTIKDMLSNGRKADRVPALVYSLARGDTSLLAPAASDLYNGLSSGFSAMQFAVSCSDGWSDARRRLAQAQAPRSAFGDAPFVHLDPDLCREAGAAKPAADSLLPIWSTVRTLAVSGTLDSNTPGFQAAEVLWGLVNGGSLLVDYGFHETLPSPDVQAVVAEFLGGADISHRIVHEPPLRFLTIEEAKAAPQPAH